MTHAALLRRTGMIALTLSALSATACAEPDNGQTGTVQSPATDLVEATLCDTEAFRDMADSISNALRATFGSGEPPDSVLSLVSEPYLHHGAAHDCQRLITPNVMQGDRMDSLPLVALFVSTSRVQSGSFAPGRTVAEIVNYGPGPYAPLGIPEGISCLWIESSPSAGWRAEIRVPVTAEGNCVSGDLQPRSQVPLVVNRLQIAEPPMVYPSTGRWMWDDVDRQQFIGIRCGNGWCEIGEAGFHGTDTIPTAADVPGRWDEQILAHPRAGAPLTLSGLLGRIEPGQDNRTAMARMPGSGPPPSDSLHVATMFFTGADTAAWATYVDKLALDPPDMAIGHQVYMSAIPNPPPPGKLAWRLKSQNGAWTTVRRSASPHSGLGTVRWAWSEDDEGLWVPCDAGCCMSTGLQP